MKRFLIELAWCAIGGLSVAIWNGILNLPVYWYDWLWAFPLSLLPLTGIVVGFRRGFPDGILGIK